MRRLPRPALRWWVLGLLLGATLLIPAQLLRAAGPWPGLLGGPAQISPRSRAEASLRYVVRDADSGSLIPAKLTLVGVDGTSDPAFSENDLGRQGAGAVLAYNRIFTIRGEGSVAVPQGTYDLYISRGIEWDLHLAKRLRLGPAGASVEARLHHVIDSSGWLSADFHVHAACSYDSQVPMLHRVHEFAADGVDLIVATDHNTVCDYAPLISELGLRGVISGGSGDEVTTTAWGHFGVLPIAQDRHRAGLGAALLFERDPIDLFADLRARYPQALIDIHHARADDEIGYFTIGKLDAMADRAERPGFSFDFDALEVLNGYMDPTLSQVDTLLHDWFGLLNHGHLVTATGNSDTHHLTYNLGGYPRNFVRLADDRPEHATLPAVARELAAHHSFFTSGPFVRVSVAGAGMGDLTAARGGQIKADIEVEAAPWIAVSRVIVYLNGREHHRFLVPESQARLRSREHLTVPIARDSYLVVRVDGDRPLSPVIGDRNRFVVRPLSITNPVFIDADGNGRFDAPYAHGPHSASPQPKPASPAKTHVSASTAWEKLRTMGRPVARPYPSQASVRRVPVPTSSSQPDSGK